MTYIERGKAGIAHAFANAAIRKARTGAGYPVGASAPYAWFASADRPAPLRNRGRTPVTAQATLPGRQVNRVVFIAGPYRNARFVGLPTWHCNAAE